MVLQEPRQKKPRYKPAPTPVYFVLYMIDYSENLFQKIWRKCQNKVVLRGVPKTGAGKGKKGGPSGKSGEVT